MRIGMPSLALNSARALPKYGPERLLNPEFVTDTIWVKEAGWSIASGLASYSTSGAASVLRQASVFDEIGATYQIRLFVASVNASNFVAYSGANNVIPATSLITTLSATGLFEGEVVSYVDSFVIRGGVSTVGSVEWASVRKVLR